MLEYDVNIPKFENKKERSGIKMVKKDCLNISEDYALSDISKNISDISFVRILLLNKELVK
jgi:hypothetical protein